MTTQDTAEQTEQKTAHTPGPWDYDGCRVYAPAYDTVTMITHNGEPVEHRGGLVALVYTPFAAALVTEDYTGMHDANGRVMAAAPELLTALEDLLAIAEQTDRFNLADLKPHLDAARAAIQKAEGVR